MSSEEDDLMKTAMVEFGLNFARYIKEVNPALWKRAVDYAKDTTDVEGVSFNYPEEDERSGGWKVDYQSQSDEDWYNEWFTEKGPNEE